MQTSQLFGRRARAARVLPTLMAALALSACGATSPSGAGTDDALKGGIPANGHDKSNNGQHTGQDDAGVDHDDHTPKGQAGAAGGHTAMGQAGARANDDPGQKPVAGSGGTAGAHDNGKHHGPAAGSGAKTDDKGKGPKAGAGGHGRAHGEKDSAGAAGAGDDSDT